MWLLVDYVTSLIEQMEEKKKTDVSHLDVTINKPVQLDIIVILTEWINENFGNFQPTDVEAKLMSEKIVNLNKVKPQKVVTKTHLQGCEKGKV